ncbi:MAG: hypothetical protein ACJ749_15760, partial [Flavisolibacter sp.]
PDSLIYLSPPDKDYKDDKAIILVDGVLGDKNLRSGKWIAFTKNKMEALMAFDNDIPVSKVSISSLVDMRSYLMPPVFIEVWGGDDPKQLKLLKRVAPNQPAKYDVPYQKLYEVKFTSATVRYVKIIATPVSKLPAWHDGKGKPAWFFTDEIFVN